MSSNDDDDMLFFKIEELATRTRRSVRTLERHIECGLLKKASPPRKRILIAREEVLSYEDRMRRGLV